MSILPLLPTAILKTTSDAIIATDLQGLIRFWNPGAVRIFGFTEEDAISKSLDLIIPENLRAKHWEGFRQVVASGHSHYGDGDILAVPGLTKAGRRISLEFTIVMLRHQHGELAGMVSILRDVTKRFEELRALRRRVSEVSGLEPGKP